MTLYDDALIALDESGVTIKSYVRPGKARFIAYDDIRSAELIDLKGGTGKYRLVGISPGRLRTFFHWDANRSHKPVGISLDVGKWLHRAITPEDPNEVLRVIKTHDPAAPS